MNINDYLAKSYGDPPCWELVSDVYANELGLPVTEYKTVNSDVRSVSRAFRLALSKSPEGFVRVDAPTDYAVILLSRYPRLGWHHCGLVIGSSVLHAVESGIGGVKYEAMSTVLDVYRQHQYWARA